VPQAPQNLRVTPSEELNAFGAPLNHVQAAGRYPTQVTNGAPDCRRHERQWQWAIQSGFPLAV
tara:strand:+ start:2392 stop:2580 length:189 start_codon:yes stop_codon:yes gene_type:complete